MSVASLAALLSTRGKMDYEKDKEATLAAKKECMQANRKCKAGMNLDAPNWRNAVAPDNEPKGTGKRKRQQKRSALVCPICEGKGHKTARIKKCHDNKENPLHQQWFAEEAGHL